LKRNKIYILENTIKIEICAVNPNLNPKPFISHQNKAPGACDNGTRSSQLVPE
jgi:hypothetical protein